MAWKGWKERERKGHAEKALASPAAQERVDEGKKREEIAFSNITMRSGAKVERRAAKYLCSSGRKGQKRERGNMHFLHYIYKFEKKKGKKRKGTLGKLEGRLKEKEGGGGGEKLPVTISPL